MKEVTSRLLTDYNNERMFTTTLDLYDRRDERRDEEGSVVLHYQAIVAGLMLGHNVDRIVSRLKGCLDYTSVVEGDLCRDQALALIRRHADLDEAESLIRKAMHYHYDDPERQAVDLQAEARLQEAHGRPNEAYATLRQALDTHEGCPQPKNMTLFANTAFHTLRLAVKVGDRSSRYAHQALRIVTSNDQSWQKRWAARAMYYLPRATGVNLVERFA